MTKKAGRQAKISLKDGIQETYDWFVNKSSRTQTAPGNII